MSSISPRAARLQALRDRWFTEALGIQFPDIGLPAPTTCDELVRGERIASAFSVLADAPEAAGMTQDAALAADRDANSSRFGIEDPRALLAELSRQIDKAPSELVDPETFKNASVLLRELKADSEALAGSPDPDVAANHLAEATAIGKAATVVGDLASELGISLPVNREARRKR